MDSIAKKLSFYKEIVTINLKTLKVFQLRLYTPRSGVCELRLISWTLVSNTIVYLAIFSATRNFQAIWFRVIKGHIQAYHLPKGQLLTAYISL